MIVNSFHFTLGWHRAYRRKVFLTFIVWFPVFVSRLLLRLETVRSFNLVPCYIGCVLLCLFMNYVSLSFIYHHVAMHTWCIPEQNIRFVNVFTWSTLIRSPDSVTSQNSCDLDSLHSGHIDNSKCVYECTCVRCISLCVCTRVRCICVCKKRVAVG